MNAVGYARVSTLDQAREGVSLEAQQERIRLYCAANALELSAIYTDEGESAGTPLAERAKGAELVRAIDAGNVSAVVALKLDRLFRNAVDCLDTVQRWEKGKTALHLIDMGGQALNTRSAAGRFFLTIMAAAGEMERLLIGERTATALAEKKRQGVRLGGVPFGFREARPGGPLIAHAVELRAVRLILSCADEGMSLRGIAARLTADGHRTQRGGHWQAETVRKIIERRPTYDAALRSS